MFLIRAITTSAELRQAQYLRAQIYDKEGLETPDNFYHGRLIDRDDETALHFGAFTVGADLMIGTFKIRIRRPWHPMRVEGIWDRRTLLLPKNLRSIKVAEMARLAVLEEYRSSAVHIGLWQAVYRIAEVNGVAFAYAMQREGPLRNQDTIGMPVQRLGDPVEIHGYSYTPTRIAVPEVISSIHSVHPGLAYFFSRDLPGGLFDARDALRPPADELAAFSNEFRRIHAVPNPISA